MGSRGVLLFRGTLSGHTRVEAKPRFLQRSHVEWGSNVFALAGPSHLHNAVSTAWMAMPSRRGVGCLPPDQPRAGSGKDCTSGGGGTVMENLGSWSRCRSKAKVNSLLLDDLLPRSICSKGTTIFSSLLSSFNLIQFNLILTKLARPSFLVAPLFRFFAICFT